MTRPEQGRDIMLPRARRLGGKRREKITRAILVVAFIFQRALGYAPLIHTAHNLMSTPLKRSGPEEEFNNIPLVRLQPVELNRRNRPQVQAINVCGVYKL